MRDQNTGRVKGFGFVKYSSQVEAEKAIKALDGRVCVPLVKLFWLQF
jgi:cold-inducible RNA-binding protein